MSGFKGSSALLLSAQPKHFLTPQNQAISVFSLTLFQAQ